VRRFLYLIRKWTNILFQESTHLLFTSCARYVICIQLIIITGGFRRISRLTREEEEKEKEKKQQQHKRMTSAIFNVWLVFSLALPTRFLRFINFLRKWCCFHEFHWWKHYSLQCRFEKNLDYNSISISISVHIRWVGSIIVDHCSCNRTTATCQFIGRTLNKFNYFLLFFDEAHVSLFVLRIFVGCGYKKTNERKSNNQYVFYYRS
jgi:hypothetical protein